MKQPPDAAESDIMLAGALGLYRGGLCSCDSCTDTALGKLKDLLDDKFNKFIEVEVKEESG